MALRWFAVICAALLYSVPVRAQGLLVPTDASLPPLALTRQEAEVHIDEQVALTKVTQVFRNPSSQPLEATYVFPVPKGADVHRFSMWVDGKEEKGELVEADKARHVYTDIVRRAKDPGLLEYVGQDLVKVRVFPVPAHGEQKLSVSYASVAAREDGLVEYVFPLKHGESSAYAPSTFQLTATLTSQGTLQNIYSPSHAVTVRTHGDHEATVTLETDRTWSGKDFRLYYALGGKDVGLTALAHRPDADQPGHVMLLLSPRPDFARAAQAPRDMVFVLDTSGSMLGVKMEQARKALKYCLGQLRPGDRFALVNFATVVNTYSDGLNTVNDGNLKRARAWVDELEATGATAIDEALKTALQYRPSDTGRSFNVVFFTDGTPTIGETDPEKILKNALDRNTSGTRLFTFGVGDDVNAVLLDRLAEQTRAVSTYVRPEEDIEAKVSGLYAKISHPALTDLKLSTGDNVTLSEVFPNHLPDLFHGGQLVVLARYQGKGHARVTLTGRVGAETREFVYEIPFPAHTGKERDFVEGLWARRKVGLLLDEIRSHGEKPELTDEVVKLAKKYGITTPYTSYLVVPDGVAPSRLAMPTPPWLGYELGTSYSNAAGGSILAGVTVSSTLNPGKPGNRSPVTLHAPATATSPVGMAKPDPDNRRSSGAYNVNATINTSANADSLFVARNSTVSSGNPPPSTLQGSATAVTGKEGVDLALQLKELRERNQLADGMTRDVCGRTCVRVGDAWVDQNLEASTPKAEVRALTPAYFELLALHPELKDVLQLGQRVVWITPSGVALVVDPDAGAESWSTEQIAKLFVRQSP